MLVLDGDILSALYFLALYLLEQFQFLDIQEAHVFDMQGQAMKYCPMTTFAPRHDCGTFQAGRGHDCAICQLESIGWVEQVYRLPCKHQFHRWCLIEWLTRGDTSRCPLCRATIVRIPYPNPLCQIAGQDCPPLGTTPGARSDENMPLMQQHYQTYEV